jgi:hypothetical protein
VRQARHSQPLDFQKFKARKPPSMRNDAAVTDICNRTRGEGVLEILKTSPRGDVLPLLEALVRPLLRLNKSEVVSVSIKGLPTVLNLARSALPCSSPFLSSTPRCCCRPSHPNAIATSSTVPSIPSMPRVPHHRCAMRGGWPTAPLLPMPTRRWHGRSFRVAALAWRNARRLRPALWRAMLCGRG